MTMTDHTNLTCYDCTATYHYLGRDPRPGVCPDCGSSAVDPAGELLFERADSIEIATATPTTQSSIRVVTSDRSDRVIEFWFVLDDTADAAERTATCWRILVDDVTLNPDRVAGDSICPVDRLETMLAEAVPERFQATAVEVVAPHRMGGDVDADHGDDRGTDGFGSEDDNFW